MVGEKKKKKKKNQLLHFSLDAADIYSTARLELIKGNINISLRKRYETFSIFHDPLLNDTFIFALTFPSC